MKDLSSQILKVIVFDDDPAREAQYKQMEDSDTVSIDFRGLEGQDPIEILRNVVETDHDVIFVDHRLNKTAPGSRTLIGSGKNITPLLREKWSNIPIIGVTAAKEDCIANDGSSFFEEICDIADIGTLEALSRQIISGYLALNHKADVDSFIKLLNPPEDEKEGILHCIPDAIRELASENFIHSLYRWFRRIFYNNAGYLYNDAWAAITIGIQAKYLKEYEDRLLEAKYTGIWDDNNRPRWWKQALFQLTIKNRESVRETVQFSASKEFAINPDHFSKCYKCGEDWPEILAYTDESSGAELEPSHLECSKPHPKKNYLPYPFEEPRLII